MGNSKPIICIDGGITFDASEVEYVSEIAQSETLLVESFNYIVGLKSGKKLTICAGDLEKLEKFRQRLIELIWPPSEDKYVFLSLSEVGSDES